MVRRLEAIEDKFGHDVGSLLHLAYLAIYANASEIAHGTVFGVHFAFGLTQPGRTHKGDSHRKQFMEWTSMLLFLMSNCILSLLFTLSHYTDIKQLIQEARQERKEIGELCGWSRRDDESALPVEE